MAQNMDLMEWKISAEVSGKHWRELSSCNEDGVLIK